MTILVLAPHRELVDQCARELADTGEPVLAFTGDAAHEDCAPVPHRTPRLDVVSLPDYEASPAVELAVVGIARQVRVSAIVAPAFGDLLRAGCLREYLGLPGPGRAAALTRIDLVAQRAALSAAGIPTVPGHPVTRAADLLWHAHRLGSPIRLREPRSPGWPSVAVVRTRRDLVTFLSDLSDLSQSSGGWRGGVVAEPQIAGARIELRAGGSGRLPRQRLGSGVAGGEFRDSTAGRARLLAAVRAALPAAGDLPFAVDAVRLPDGRLLVDNVRFATDTPELLRRHVRADTGLEKLEAAS